MGKNIVVINWPLWGKKNDAVNYIDEMVKIGLLCRINHISDSEWDLIAAKFGEFVEGGEA